ncbi:MocR-like pyridoxine biosynthesis transcription factor PdxR [Burkholderia plantarii]|uniref:MocR-like pyridoxine biosynthesis transcription factor PdxR n=1 Tax=Burkholderia plantarii TaxID=41899 RepID=UPI0018DE85CA|nr:PLP-dependent aminotransferase family protein [Burkholderia plantarii]MBI0329633.1 PLP-dependent aminotransferase family protein [Burkholderia plantarii]
MAGHQHLEHGSEDPLYRQIYERFRRAIANGTYAPGARVPSVRNLASELQISRSTVELAYDLLIGEGYLVARGQAGTIVSPSLAPQQVRDSLQRAGTARPVARTPDAAMESSPPPFQLGLPALDLFPHKLWASLVTRQARVQGRLFAYPNPAGYQPLREAISAYLHISRGLDCSPEQVFVLPGYRGVTGLLSRTLLRPLDELWLEDPCFPPSRYLFAEMGARIVPVPVDKDGLSVAKGKELAPHARFALVTPAHQSPLGVPLSLARRLELITWAQQSNAFIIEDDYDSEFRYDGRPLPALASLVATGNVLYVGTFSKALSPALRLAYLVVPKPLVARFNEACARLHDGCPVLIQGVTADFINEGYFARHLKKMRAAYSQRREMVIDSMRATFGGRMQYEDMPCGLNLIASLDDGEDDRLLAQRAKSRNLAVEPLSGRYIEAPPKKGLLLGFANVKSEEQALALARELKAAIEAD